MHDAYESEVSKQTVSSGIRRRILKGFGAQGFSQAVQIFIRLAEVPLLLSFWGTQCYGEWLMLSAIPAYLSIADGGFAGAACREMTMRSGSGDRNGTLSVFQTSWLLLVVVSLTAGFLAFCFIKTIPLKDCLGFSVLKEHEIKITLFLLVVYVMVGFQGGLLNGGFWVMGCYSSSMYFVAVMQVFEFTGLAAAVTLGGGPVEAAFGYLSGRFLGTALMWFGQLRVSPWLRHGVSYASIGELQRLIAPALASLAFPLGNALNIQGIRIAVGLVLGPSAVALFTPLRTLSRLVMQPANIINQLIQPELAIAYGAGNRFIFQRLFARSCQLTLWGCLSACLLVGPGAYWIFPAWASGKVMMHWPTYLILLGGVLINSIWYTSLMVPLAINRHGSVALAYALVYGVGAFGLCFVGANRWGLSGVAFVLLLAEAAMIVVVILSSLRITRMRLAKWAQNVLRPPVDLFGRDGLGFWKRITAMAELLAVRKRIKRQFAGQKHR